MQLMFLNDAISVVKVNSPNVIRDKARYRKLESVVHDENHLAILDAQLILTGVAASIRGLAVISTCRTRSIRKSFVPRESKMNKQIVLLCLGFSWLLSIPGAVYAQVTTETEQGLSYVLNLGGIDREIELTPQQHDQLFGLWLEINFDLQKAFQDYRDNFSETLPASRQAEVKQKLAEAIANIRKKELERLEKSLLADQLNRLKQLRIQYLSRQGGGVKILREELDLNPGQIRKIEQAAESMKRQLTEIQSHQREEQLTKTEILEIVKELREQSLNEVMSCLTDAQKRKLKLLQGEAFDFATGRLVNAEAKPAAGKDNDQDAGQQNNDIDSTEKTGSDK
jgi:hypothetical protein